MALVTPVEVLGVCRVSVTPETEGPPAAAGSLAYDFNNGFVSVAPKGAVDGSAGVYYVGPGDYLLFLNDAYDAGSALNQGGVTAEVMSTGVGLTPPATPTVAFGTVEVSPVLSLAAVGTSNYAAVDPERALRVRFYDATGAATDVEKFTVIAHRNPVTIILK